MKFWDTSAVVPLLVDEPATPAIMELLRQERRMHVWWATGVECVAGIARLERAGTPSDRLAAALERLEMLSNQWIEVQPVESVREAARRLLRVHPLRTAGALQLAAAVVLTSQAPAAVPFVCLDHRLRDAAAREGFTLLPHPRDL